MSSLISNQIVKEVIEWFTKVHKKWVKDNGLISWAGKLGIELNRNGILDEDQLFHLFVLAVLWNNKPTFRAEKGERVFLDIRKKYTLEKFLKAIKDNSIAVGLRKIASKNIRNSDVFNLLMFIVNGNVDGKPVWAMIKEALNFPNIGHREDDMCRLKQLYGLFNPRRYEGRAYLTVKIFLIFREIRIQFRNSGKYQYHPMICCVPDSHVREALIRLNILGETGSDIDNLLEASDIVAQYFCKESCELYDLPLFLWHKESVGKASLRSKIKQNRSSQGKYAGKCPQCGSRLVWRRALRTGELYRGCTNFKEGCRWNDRSY